MKFSTIECPNCGGNLHIEEGRDTCFCSFCGKQIAIDDGTKQIRIVDEARIREAESKERIRMEELKQKQLEKDRQRKAQIIGIIVGLILLIVLYYMLFHL